MTFLSNSSAGFSVPTKTLISAVVNVRSQTIKLILDEDITATDENFLHNLITEKASINVLRGDQLIITKTSFPNSKINQEVELESDTDKTDTPETNPA